MRLFAVFYLAHRLVNATVSQDFPLFFLIFQVNKGQVLPVSFCQDSEEDSLELGSGALESEKYSNTQICHIG
jgi:hypothetical protein